MWLGIGTLKLLKQFVLPTAEGSTWASTFKGADAVRGETRASEGDGAWLSSDGGATPARRADDRRLRAREARYQALVAATAQIVWTFSPDGAVDDMPAWRAYTGQSVEEVRGWGWLDALHPEDRALAARLWAEAVAARSACDYTSRLQPETVAVERERATEVAYRQGDHMYARLDLFLLCAGHGVCLRHAI